MSSTLYELFHFRLYEQAESLTSINYIWYTIGERDKRYSSTYSTLKIRDSHYMIGCVLK